MQTAPDEAKETRSTGILCHHDSPCSYATGYIPPMTTICSENRKILPPSCCSGHPSSSLPGSVNHPWRGFALSLIMVLCLLIYRLAEYRLRARLAQTEQTIPDQVQKPTARPTMRLSSFNVL